MRSNYHASIPTAIRILRRKKNPNKLKFYFSMFICVYVVRDMVLIDKEKTRTIRYIKAYSNESQLQSSFIIALHHSHFDVQFISLQNRNSNSDSNRNKQTNTHTPSSDCNNDSFVARLQYLISECYGHHFEFLNEKMLKGKSNNLPLLHFLYIVRGTRFCAPLLFTEGKRRKKNEGNSIQIVKWSFYAHCKQNLYWLLVGCLDCEQNLNQLFSLLPTDILHEYVFQSSRVSTLPFYKTNGVSLSTWFSFPIIMYCHSKCAEQIDFRFCFHFVFILDLILLLNCKRLHSFGWIYVK